ncbi:Guanine nucleotide exchange factor lte1 [Malassezia nana]|uniref:Guanine nucleotide exchange factor lte1 n=1 Tax=Malassezia nana TaxID=180528 RepID=A0AAF0EJ40_9BASI|nr:Guanine nucleotide exchange factor lte1 [Malassezia nana]
MTGSQTGRVASAPVPRTENFVPTVVQVGPPSHGSPVVPSTAPPVSAPAMEDSGQEDVSFTTAPVMHGDAASQAPNPAQQTTTQLPGKPMDEERQIQQPANTGDLTRSSISNDVSYEPTFGADALIRPYDPSIDSSVLTVDDATTLQAFRVTKWEENAPMQPDENVRSAVEPSQEDPSATSAVTTIPVDSPPSMVPSMSSNLPIPLPQERSMPAPPLDAGFMPGLGPVLPTNQAAAYSSPSGSGNAASPIPANTDTLSNRAAESQPQGTDQKPVTVIATSKDDPNVILRPWPAHQPGMQVLHVVSPNQVMPPETNVDVSPAPETSDASVLADRNAASTEDPVRSLSNDSPAEPPVPDSNGDTPQVPSDTYRFEWMFGPHTLVYDDACTKSTGPVPVAYTYDDWFVEQPQQVKDKSDRHNTTAVVITSPALETLEKVPLCLGVFMSTLVQSQEGSYVLDMAAPLDYEVPPDVPREQKKPMPITTIRRNVRLFSRSQHQVVAATMQRLVVEMTSGSSPGLMQDVFLGYRQYLGAPRLLDLLLSRMEWAIIKIGDASAFKVALSVLLHTQAALWHWLQYYYEHDFAPNETLMHHLVQWMADQDERVQFWQYASDPSMAAPPPAYLQEAPTAVPEHDEELPNNDPSERMHALCSLVQALAPPSLLPAQDGQPSAPKEATNKTMLRKSRSLTRMLAQTHSPSRSRKHHLRWPSISGNSVLAAVGSIPAVHGTNTSPRVPTSPYGPGSVSSPSMGESSLESTQPSRLERSRSLKSLRRMLRRGADISGDGSAEESPKTRLDATMAEDDAGDDTQEQDTALQLLERALSETPRLDAGPSPRPKDGPIQWIPAHTGSSWREAQRLSIQAAHVLQQRNLGEPASRIQQRDTFLLCQRSSTIARQLGTLERQLLACVQWHELAEPSWEQHTVEQEQWQREYQEYIVDRIRAASSTNAAQEPPSSLPTKGVHLLIARFNRACAWVASHIVTTTDLQERVMVVNKFIRIAWHCFRQGNMETLCQIMFGLQSPWVARLQQTWAKVALWELRAFDALRRFTSPRNQFAFLRQSMMEVLDVNASSRSRFSNPNNTSTPYVPFFGLFISDLSATDGLSSFVDSSLMPSMIPFYDDHELSQSWDVLVNVYRLRMKACIVREFITLQRHERSAPEHPMELPILVESLQLDTLSSAAIQSASMVLEP